MAKTLAGKVRSAMKSTGIPKSVYQRSGQVRGWGQSSYGYKISAPRGMEGVWVSFTCGVGEAWKEQRLRWRSKTVEALGRLNLSVIKDDGEEMKIAELLPATN